MAEPVDMDAFRRALAAAGVSVVCPACGHRRVVYAGQGPVGADEGAPVVVRLACEACGHVQLFAPKYLGLA